MGPLRTAGPATPWNYSPSRRLARPLEAVSEWDQSILTQARRRTTMGLAVGTAGYMAPEQLTGAPASLRADVWSLGAMLDDLIADDRVEQRGGHTLMAQVVAGTVAFPDTDLGRLSSAALSLDPEARPADASMFAATLRQCVEPQRVTPAIGDCSGCGCRCCVDGWSLRRLDERARFPTASVSGHKLSGMVARGCGPSRRGADARNASRCGLVNT
ncbi:MAG: hypothetical protein ACI855_003703 [Myxococcota bacterium]|jgi:hypothetical protein